MNHTPEPWFLPAGSTCIENKDGEVPRMEANEIRKVICVNACAGMEDPVAEVERLKLAQFPDYGHADMCDALASELTIPDHKFQNFGFEIRDNNGKVIMDSNGLYGCSFNKEVSQDAHLSWYDLGELPPVGTECEVLNLTLGIMSDWEKCTIIFVGKFRIIYNSESCNERVANITGYPALQFRPIQTEKQKSIKEIIDILPSSGFCYDVDKTAQEIYEKFIAKKE